MRNRIKSLLLTVGMLPLLFLTFQSALAAEKDKAAAAANSNVTKAFTEAGINKTGDMSGLYKDADALVGIVIGLGVFWAIGCVVFGAIQLSGSAGNPQKRNIGIASIVFALVGVFIMYKSYEIAGWATGLGS